MAKRFGCGVAAIGCAFDHVDQSIPGFVNGLLARENAGHIHIDMLACP